jgi:hypothetical protein
MIKSRGAASKDITKKPMPALLIVFEFFVCGLYRNNVYFVLQRNGLAGFGPNETAAVHSQMSNVLRDAAWQNKMGLRLILTDRLKRWNIQVIPMNMGAEYVIQLGQIANGNWWRFHSLV